MTDVRLVDLDVIKRFSLAVRQDAVPAEELLASLDASRALVVAALAAGKPEKAVKSAKAVKAARGPAATGSTPRKRAPK